MTMALRRGLQLCLLKSRMSAKLIEKGQSIVYMLKWHLL